MNFIQVLRFIGMALLLPLLAVSAAPEPAVEAPTVAPKPSASAPATEQPPAAAAPTYETVFEQSYQTTMVQQPRALIRTSDGGYAFAGTVDITVPVEKLGERSKRFGLWLNKVDRDGTLQWQRIFASKVVGGWRREEAYTLVETRDRGLLVAGLTSSDDITGVPMGKDGTSAKSAARASAGLIVRYDKNGAERWRKTMGDVQKRSVNAFFASVAVSGGYVLAGVTTVHSKEKFASPRGKRVLWLMKIDDAGKPLWERKFEDIEVAGQLLGRKLVTTAEGGVVLALSSKQPATALLAPGMDIVDHEGKVLSKVPPQQVMVLRFDKNGRETKRATFPAATDVPVIAGNADGYLVAGYNRVAWYASFDKDLKQRWKKIAADNVRLTGVVPEHGGFRGAGALDAASLVYITSTGEWRVEPTITPLHSSRIADVAGGDEPGEFTYLWYDLTLLDTKLIKMRLKKN
jgi:hypothetical protein